jgi:hypothetical protein
MKSIRTFTEQMQDETVPDAIDKALEEAGLMIVLGFGFHQQNMQLFVPSYTDRWRPRLSSVICTMRGLHGENQQAIKDRMGGQGLRISVAPKLLDMTSAELMSKLRLSISMAAA